MELVHAQYDKADEATRRMYQSWLESESKTSALYAYWFEFKTRSLFHCSTGEEVEVKALESNEGLQKGRSRHSEHY